MAKRSGQRAEPTAAAPPQAEEPVQKRTRRARIEDHWVAVVLAVLTVFRSGVDGITWPAYNTYFLWVIIITFGVWTMRRTLRGGGSLRHGTPVALLGAFMVIAFLTGLETVQVDATYRNYLFWLGYFFLFVLATNALRSRASIAIVLTGFVVAQLCQSVYALLHYWYVLPYVREQLMHNPRLLQSFFGASEMNAELAHRLNVNRAFGVFLFPNALAAFLIVGIPFTLSEICRSLCDVRAALREPRAAVEGVQAETRRMRALITWAVLMGVGVSVGYYLYTYIYLIVTTRSDWGVVGVAFYAGVVPLALATALSVLTARYGLYACGLVVRAVVMPLLIIPQAIALWLTYSRGGILALLMALAAVVLLLFAARHRHTGVLPSIRPAVRTALLCCAIGGLLCASLSAIGAQETPSQAPSPEQSMGNSISVQGIHLSAADLANPASLKLRISYWKSGLRMAWANFWTGVGLGNFGTVYPMYQEVGAGATKAAHDDYLQAWCETGIFGFLAFVGMWAYFAITGARRILRESDLLTRLTLAGLYGGVLAFLIHALVDFNFFNPSLVFFVFLLSGVFYAYSSIDEPDTARGTKWHQYLAVPLLIIVALTAGASVRVYVSDAMLNSDGLNVGDLRAVRARLSVAESLLRTIQTASEQPGRAAALSVSDLAAFINSRKVIESFGELRAPVPGSTKATRAIPEDEAVPPNAFLVVRDSDAATQLIRNGVEQWIGQIQRADSIFPYSPQVSGLVYQAYVLLQAVTKDPDLRKAYISKSVDWAEATVARSPMQSWYHDWLGRAYWLRAGTEPVNVASQDFRRGVDEFRRAKDLYPSSGEAWRAYGNHLVRLGQGLIRGGEEDQGDALINEGREALRHAKSLGVEVSMP